MNEPSDAAGRVHEGLIALARVMGRSAVRQEMARLYGVSEPTVSRIVAAHRQSVEVKSS